MIFGDLWSLVMNITFYFTDVESWKKIEPHAKSKENIKEIELLASVLIEVDLEFSKKMLEKLKQPSEQLDLSTQSWGVLIDKEQVEIYFLYDEDNLDYKRTISRAIFKRAMTEWNKFIQLDASSGEVTISLPT